MPKQEVVDAADHPEFDPAVVKRVEELQKEQLTGQQIALYLLKEGIAVVPAVLAFVHLGYHADLYREVNGEYRGTLALHVEDIARSFENGPVIPFAFFLPKVIWDLAAHEEKND